MDCYEKNWTSGVHIAIKTGFFSEVGVEAYILYMKSKHYSQKDLEVSLIYKLSHSFIIK